MPGTEEKKIEESSVSASISKAAILDLNSDNSQSPSCAPPDITNTDHRFSICENNPELSEPPDLNPEEHTVLSQQPPCSPDALVTTADQISVSHSSEPPDLTGTDDFPYTEDTNDSDDAIPIDCPDFQHTLGQTHQSDQSLGILLSDNFDQGESEQQDPYFGDNQAPTELLDSDDCSPEGFLASSFPESNLAESLQAVAPGDILAVSLPQPPPITLKLSTPPSIKRGPGRPRKDGVGPIQRKRVSLGKTSTKSSIKKGVHIHPSFVGLVRSFQGSAMDSVPIDPPTQEATQVVAADIPGPSSSMMMDYDPEMQSLAMEDDQASSSYSVMSGESSDPLEPLAPPKLCSLCNCGERSLLGQGELNRYDPTTGFNPLKKTLGKSRNKTPEFDERTTNEKGPKPLTWRRHRGPLKGNKERSKSPRRYPHNSDDDPTCILGDELSMVGYPEDIDLTQVFEPSGHTLAHHCCAAWSEGVVQTHDLLLKFVDRAVYTGLSQKCSYCRNYGATINCRVTKCNKKYHYPCASARGCFQDIKTLSLLCPDHTDQAETIAGEEALCVICDLVGNISEQLFCTSCGHHYHGSCLHPSVAMTPEVRAGWQCPDCKICQMCRNPGEDSKMLVCDTCDKGYHTFCLKPVMTTIPKNGWKCKNCRVCGDCGSRTPGSGPSSRWHLNYSVCDSCYQQRNKGLSCPLCGKAYRQFTQKAMILCNTCKKHVHAECDETIDSGLLQKVKEGLDTDYMCTICRSRDPAADMDLPYPYALPGPLDDSSEDYLLNDVDDLETMSFIGDGSNPFLMNEDSVSSIDIDISVIEKGAAQLSQLTSPSHPHPHGEGHGIGSKGGKLSAMSRKKMGAGRPRGRPLAPEKKKRPPTFGERKRGPKPKLKTGQLGISGQITSAPAGEAKTKSQDEDDDGDDHPTTLILANSKDDFVLEQDVCKSCGSFGKGKEGKLIVCTQCGQCYHPYCVSVKVTKVVLQKGWRCLDCTVCEGCGKPHDEGRLILCDECDISYHIYCLDPPLDHVPKGTWKCKWCVMCVNCGSTTPGFGCQWQNNYTQCGPCSSKQECPACQKYYREDDLVIQCVQCDRWIHGQCDQLKNEDDAERAADFGYHCLFCRPKTGQPGPLPPPPPPSPPEEIEMKALSPLPPPPPPPPPMPPREPEPPKKFFLDGVCLSESGHQQIQSITVHVPKPKRVRKKMDVKPPVSEGSLPLSPPAARLMSMQSQSSIDGEESMDILKDDDGKLVDLGEGLSIPPSALMEGDLGPEGLGLISPTLNPGLPATADNAAPDGVVKKKRRCRRNTVNIGIGGFMVRSRVRPTPKQQSVGTETSGPVEDGHPKPEGSSEVTDKPTAEGETPSEEPKKKRIRRTKKKSALEEYFPTYMQEAFFGKEMLEKTKATGKESVKIDSGSDIEESRTSPVTLGFQGDQPLIGPGLIPTSTVKVPSSSHLLPSVGQPLLNPMGVGGSSDDLQETDLDLLPDTLPQDEELISIINKELAKGPNELPILESGTMDTETHPEETSQKHEPKLDSILSPRFDDDEKNLDVDKIFTEDLVHMDIKTVEDIFKGVMETDPRPSGPPAPPGFSMPGPGPGPGPGPAPHIQGKEPPHPPPGMDHPQVPMNPCMGQAPLAPLVMPPPQGFPSNFSPSAMSPGGFPNNQPPWQQVMAQEDEQQEQVTSRRNMQKWESDEELGEHATISAVLYCNLKHPELRHEHPDWQERVKKIGKIWRQLPSDDKQPYLLQARKNRSSSKGQKARKAKRDQAAAAAAAMGPPALPSSYSQPTTPDGLGSPMSGMAPGQEICSPLSRTSSNSQIMGPKTPDGQSPSHMMGGVPLSPNHPGGVQSMMHLQDPYAQPPGTPMPMDMAGMGPRPMRPQIRPQDPYAQAPATPRPHDPFGQPRPQGPFQPGMPPRPQDPYGQHPGGPRQPMYSQHEGPPRPPGPYNHPASSLPPDQMGGPFRGPQGRVPDMFNQENNAYPQPMTPARSSVPTTPQQSPSKPQWPGVAQETDPYEHPVPTPRPMSSPSTPQTPTSQPFDPFSQHPSGPQRSGQLPGMAKPMLPRQTSVPSDPYAHPPSTPGGPMTRPEDPYAFSPPTPRPVSESYSPRSTGKAELSPQQGGHRPGDPYSQMIPGKGPMPGQPGSEGFIQHPNMPGGPQRSMAGPQGQPIPSADSYGMHARHPFRAPVPPTSQPRPHGYPDPHMPQGPHHHGGMEPPKEPSVLQQMFAAASRRHAQFPFSGMFSTLKHNYLGGGGVMDKHRDIHPQQLRDILAEQTKKRQQKKMEMINKQMSEEGAPPGGLPSPRSGGAGGFSPEEGPPRFPGPGGPSPGIERWSQSQQVVRPPQPRHFRPPDMDMYMRGQFDVRPGVPGAMRQPRPPGPLSPHNQFSPRGSSPQMSPVAGQHAGFKPHLLQLVQERMRQPNPGKPQPTTPGAQPGPSFDQFNPAGDLPKMPFDPNRPQGQGHPVPTEIPQVQPPTVKHEPKDVLPGKTDEAGGRTALPKTQKQVMSSEDEKQDTEDENISDLLDNDGSFDILKYADPELDFGDQGKSILDDLVEESKAEDSESEVKSEIDAPRSNKSVEKDGTETQDSIKMEDDKGESGPKSVPPMGAVNFQAKFLEFSKRKQEERNGDGTPGPLDQKPSIPEADKNKNKSQIAAILQNPDHMRPQLDRRDSVKSDSGSLGKPSGTPTGLPGMEQAGIPLGSRQSFSGGMPSPLHQIAQVYPGSHTQPSPSSTGGKFHQQSPGTPSLPSPKVLPSPKSNIPSPRTPNVPSPFSQQSGLGGQLSPFSQTVQSPFSPPVSSAAHSPFSAPPATSSAPQSPYGPPGRTQSPFTLPVTGSTGNSQSPFGAMSQPSPMSATQPPGQRSPRGTITPTNQYMQGTYGQPMMPVPPRGATTLQPTPNSILYGQSSANQQINKVPTGMSGPRMPFTSQGIPQQGPPQSMDHQQQHMEMTSPGGTPIMRMPRASLPEGVTPEQAMQFQGQQQNAASMYQGNMQGPRPQGGMMGTQGQGQPPGPPGHPGMRMPGMRPPTPTATTTAQSKVRLLQDQPLLIQDLLDQVLEKKSSVNTQKNVLGSGMHSWNPEQEKQEQQRQAQQQAILHRRDNPGGMEGMPPGSLPQGVMPPSSMPPGSMPPGGMPPGSMPPGGMPPRMEGMQRPPGFPMQGYRPRMEHPSDPNQWPRMFGPQEGGPPQQGKPGFPPRMPVQQMRQFAPGVPPQQGPGPAPGAPGGPGMAPPPHPPPLPPMQGELNPELERQHLQYEEWLIKQSQYLEMQVKALEQQINKCKRTKKAINARGRSAKKANKEVPLQDTQELERVTQEQSMLQKQLEGLRKQFRTHQMQAQEYRTKKRERFGLPVQPPQSTQPSPTPGGPDPAAIGGPLQPRIPGGPGTVRLTASARQEYDNYMQQRLRQQQQQMGARPPMHTVVEYPQGKTTSKKKKATKVCKATTIQDNNPFSEEYLEREQIQKQQDRFHMVPGQQGAMGQPPSTGTADTPDANRQMHQFFGGERPPFEGSGPFSGPRMPGPGEPRPRFPGEHGPRFLVDQGPRFPGDPSQGPRFPGDQGQRFPGDPNQGPRFTGEQGHRFPGDQTARFPGDQGQRFPGQRFMFDPRMSSPGERPPYPGANPQAMRMPGMSGGPGGPAGQGGIPTFQSSFGLPPSANMQQQQQSSEVGSTGQEQPMDKPKPKKRKKKKKQTAENAGSAASATPTNPGPPTAETRPPIQFTPQSETEKRIMEILNNTAKGLAKTQDKPETSKSQDTSKSPGSASGSDKKMETSQAKDGVVTSLPPASFVPSPASQTGPPSQTLPPPSMMVRPPGPGAMPPTGHPEMYGHQRPPGPAQQQQGPPQSLHGSTVSAQMPPQVASGQRDTNVEGEESRTESEPIMPMNVMIQQTIPQRATGPPQSPQTHESTQAGKEAESHTGITGIQSVVPNNTPIGPYSYSSQQAPSGLPPHMSQMGPHGHSAQKPGMQPRSPHAAGMQERHSPHPSQDRKSPHAASQSPHPGGMQEKKSPHSSSHSPHPGGIQERKSPHAAGMIHPDQHNIHMQGMSERKSPHTSGQYLGIVHDHHSPRQSPVGPHADRQSPRQSMQQGGSYMGMSYDHISPRQSPHPSGQHMDRQSPRQAGSYSDRQGPYSAMMERQSPHAVERQSPNSAGSPRGAGVDPRQSHQDKSAIRQPQSGPTERMSPRAQGPAFPYGQFPQMGPGPIRYQGQGGKPHSSPPSQPGTQVPPGFMGPRGPPRPPGSPGHAAHPAFPSARGLRPQNFNPIPEPQMRMMTHQGQGPPPPSSLPGQLQQHIASSASPAFSQPSSQPAEANKNTEQECTDGIHCGTPPLTEKCTDGVHCGTPPLIEKCSDGIHCGTPPLTEKCSDGIHCGSPPLTEKCSDGIHCGTPPLTEKCSDGIHCGTPPLTEKCTDGIHCGTPPLTEKYTDDIHCGTPPLTEKCSDGIHCGTPLLTEKCSDGIHCGTPSQTKKCTDGIHCGTPPPPPENQGVCMDGIHCGTPPPPPENQGGCTDGIHCGTPPPPPEHQGVCTDGIHCGTPPLPPENQGGCTDGIHCGTPPLPPENQGGCTDGIHCGTPPPPPENQGVCTDGIHCGTPPPPPENQGVCTDGIHCGTPPPPPENQGGCTDGIHCGTPPPPPEHQGVCTDGIHCGTPPPPPENQGVCTDGIHCGTPPPPPEHQGVCMDGIHCGTPPPPPENQGVCTDGNHCGTPPPPPENQGVCTDGIHCGTPPPPPENQGVCTDGIHCGTPPPPPENQGVCTDGIHCGTPPPPPENQGVCTDGIHCGTPPLPPENQGVCTDGIHCGTPPPPPENQGVCTDGIHCGTPPLPPENQGVCTDGIHCGTPPPPPENQGVRSDGKHCDTPSASSSQNTPNNVTISQNNTPIDTTSSAVNASTSINTNGKPSVPVSDKVSENKVQSQSQPSQISNSVPVNIFKPIAPPAVVTTNQSAGPEPIVVTTVVHSVCPTPPSNTRPVSMEKTGPSPPTPALPSNPPMSYTSTASAEVPAQQSQALVPPQTLVPSSGSAFTGEVQPVPRPKHINITPNTAPQDSNLATSLVPIAPSHSSELTDATRTSQLSHLSPAQQLGGSAKHQDTCTSGSNPQPTVAPSQSTVSMNDTPSTQMSNVVSQHKDPAQPSNQGEVPIPSSDVSPPVALNPVTELPPVPTLNTSPRGPSIPKMPQTSERPAVAPTQHSDQSPMDVSHSTTSSLASKIPSSTEGPQVANSSVSTTQASQMSYGVRTSQQHVSQPGSMPPQHMPPDIKPGMPHPYSGERPPGLMPPMSAGKPSHSPGMALSSAASALQHMASAVPTSYSGHPGMPASTGESQDTKPHLTVSQALFSQSLDQPPVSSVQSSTASPSGPSVSGPTGPTQPPFPHMYPGGQKGPVQRQMMPSASMAGPNTSMAGPRAGNHQGMMPNYPMGQGMPRMPPHTRMGMMGPDQRPSQMPMMGPRPYPPQGGRPPPGLQHMPPHQRMKMPPGYPQYLPPHMQRMPPPMMRPEQMSPDGVPMSSHMVPQGMMESMEYPPGSISSMASHHMPHPPYSSAPPGTPQVVASNQQMENMMRMRHQYPMGPGFPQRMPGHMAGMPPGSGANPPGGPRFQDHLVAMANKMPPQTAETGGPPYMGMHSQMQDRAGNPGVLMTALSTVPITTLTPSLPGLVTPSSISGPNQTPPMPHPSPSPSRTPSRTPSRASSNPSPQSSVHMHTPTSPNIKSDILMGGPEGLTRQMSGEMRIKEEPMDIPQKPQGILTEEEDLKMRQNAILKQLLGTAGMNAFKKQMMPGAADGTPMESEDGSPVQLTPEQQRQLEMIEQMPLLKEAEISPEEWDIKTPEEKEKIIEMRKQEYEAKRKEFEETRKAKRKSGETRKRKKKKQQEQQNQQVPGEGGGEQMVMAPPIPPMVDGQVPPPLVQGPVPPVSVPTQPQPKKRQRKSKAKVADGLKDKDKDGKLEGFLSSLSSLPVVPLQEPRVGSFFSISPVHGSAALLTGENQLKGTFGASYLEGVADYYGSTLLVGLPPLESFMGLSRPRDIETRRKYITDGHDRLGVGGQSESQRYQLAAQNQADLHNRYMMQGHPSQQNQPSHPMFGAPVIGPRDKPVLPALPPPPRIESRLDLVSRGSDSPETVISSSSPEHGFGDVEEEYPMLRPIDPAPVDDRASPSMPLVQPIVVKASPVRPKSAESHFEIPEKTFGHPRPFIDSDMMDKKWGYDPMSISGKENDMTQSLTSSLTKPFRDADLKQDISVTVTLSAKSAEDIGGVLSTIAELLKIAVPPTYEVSRSPSPDTYKSITKHKEQAVNIHSLIKAKPKFCRHCQTVVMDGGVRKRRSEIPCLKKEDQFTFKDIEDEEVTFCTTDCCSQYIAICQMIQPHPKPVELKEEVQPETLAPPQVSALVSPVKTFDMSSPLTDTSTLSGNEAPPIPSTPTTPTSSGVSTPTITPTTPVRHKSEEKLQKKLKRSNSYYDKPLEKKWKGKRYKYVQHDVVESLGAAPGMPEIEVDVLWKALGTIIIPEPLPPDNRVCAFCQVGGDEATDGPGRMLNMDVDKYIHLNCALWSSEVYETLNGALMNVDIAYTRGLRTECVVCKNMGATLECFKSRCGNYYHVGCAHKQGCMFFQNKTLLCPAHAPKVTPDNVLESLVVHRRVYINRDEDKQVASMVHRQQEGNFTLRVGSLILHSIGHLMPYQIVSAKYHTRDYIYPVGYKSSRFYWSMRRLYKRCRYVCSIFENEGQPGFKIQVVEKGFEDLVMEDCTPRAVWSKVLEPLDKMRKNADLVKIFPNFITGEELFGLTEPTIIRVLESLPGTDQLNNYHFKFGRSSLIDMPLLINPTGCARTEPKLRTHFRRPHTLQSSNTSRSLPTTVTGVTGDLNSPYMKQFVHSKSQQYRRLKTEWKNNVYLGRSRIQGLGLFAAKDTEKHTMVIEYIGDLIRNEVANRREVIYEEQNRGVYMFRIDNEVVVDATMAGGPARYINHSCNPNCVAEVVAFDKESKIIIITNRKLTKGEELTYDYKFDFEDEQHKIPCCCGAPNCRKWMN
ncbi:histone-lysine N-methyltransferase 2C-like isoform X3 [Argopecten irradians]|uniref:histone-lysine N-methyltransferase 2C-like isoform X3 n=1 Tax=Argopecten irradians TaxID=31199 RepID=UPI003711C95F